MSVVGIVYFAGYMQWSVAWFIGPVILFVLRDQWKKTSDRRRAIAKATALASEEDVVLARLNDLPAWVSRGKSKTYTNIHPRVFRSSSPTLNVLNG